MPIITTVSRNCSLACANLEKGVWPADRSQKRLGQSSVRQKQQQGCNTHPGWPPLLESIRPQSEVAAGGFPNYFQLLLFNLSYLSQNTIQKFAFAVALGQTALLIWDGSLHKLNSSPADNRDKCATEPVSLINASVTNHKSRATQHFRN